MSCITHNVVLNRDRHDNTPQNQPQLITTTLLGNNYRGNSESLMDKTEVPNSQLDCCLSKPLRTKMNKAFIYFIYNSPNRQGVAQSLAVQDIGTHCRCQITMKLQQARV